MVIELKIPEVGESITEVQINDWLKTEGDHVNADEPVAVVDSEKTTFELPAPKAGRITKILHRAGETVKVGAVVGQIDTDGSEPTKQAKGEPAPNSNAPSTKSKMPAPEKKPETEKPASKKASSKPDKKETAEKAPPTKQPRKESEESVETDRILADAESDEAGAASAGSPSAREEEVVPMTMLRRTIARRLIEAQQTMAMLTTFNEVDLSATQALRKQHGEAFEKRYQVRLGWMSFFVKAAIDALKQYPALNAEIREQEIVYRNYFDIGVAIATERGLVVPVLRNAERMSFAELETTIGNFARRAREGKIKPDELAGGTFTITNGGVFGSLLSTPIINPPQSGILGMHTIQERPVAENGQVVIRPMMYLALTYDHRLVDGREAVLFLRRIKEAIEQPARMLIEV